MTPSAQYEQSMHEKAMLYVRLHNKLWCIKGCTEIVIYSRCYFTDNIIHYTYTCGVCVCVCVCVCVHASTWRKKREKDVLVSAL